MATVIATSELPPAMEGLVEDVPLRNPNLLTYNQVYSKVGSTRVLQAEPAVLNFGGFTLGQVFSQTLLIRNVRARGTRFHILAPSTPFFKATCANKKGLLAPGMSEEVVVEFCPSHYRYYYDCIRVHSEDENLLIPIHAYPVANETLFPTRVDFGRAAVGQELVRKHTLECKVPVDFEFEIVETRPNPCFKVEPARGVISGHGAVEVTMSFCPLNFTTEEAVIEVRIAEFNSKPVRCVLTGSGWPGAARDRALAGAGGGANATVNGSANVNGRTAGRNRGRRRAGQEDDDEEEEEEQEEEEQEEEEAEEVQPAVMPARGGKNGKVVGGDRSWRRPMTMEELDGTLALKLAATKGLLPANRGGGTLRGGAGNGDSYTAFLDLQRRERVTARDCRTAGPIRSRLPKLPPVPGETHVGGVFVPDSLLLTAAEVGYVLSQSPGRLRTKDVKGAIEARKAALAEQQAALAEVLAASGGDEGIHPLERPDIPAEVKGALFRMQLAAAEEASRKVTLGSGPAVGQQLLTPEEVTRLQRLRAEQQRRHQLKEESKATNRLQAETEAGGAIYLPPTRVSISPGRTGAASASASAASLGGVRPEWRLIEGSDWMKRTRARDMLMRAVWRVVSNLRLQKRLERIKEVLAHLGYDKQRLAEEAANPVVLVQESDRPGTAPTRYLQPEMVRVRPLPLYRDAMFQPHPPLEVSHYTDFDELAPFQLKTPLEYRLLGYSPEEFPGLTPYLPPLLDQPLMLGASEEVAAAGEKMEPSSIAPPLSDYPPLPDACKNMPYITLEIGTRYSVERIFVAPEPSYEMGYDMDYVIQPRLYDMYESGTHEAPASGSVRALRGGPALSDSWLVRQDTWAVQLGEEVVLWLMSGPEPEDQPEDQLEDADKPKICPQVPTDEQIAKYLPPSSRTETTTAAGAAAPQQQQQLQGSASSTPGRYLLVRDRHVARLEAAKAETQAAALAGWEQRLKDYNALLRRPCDFAVHL
ncbi:hypothetical protein VaNZ11_008595 [Volvox africanus]|uniref:HYDIN/VesB/CFA65-like Ig-like domain-containing protein n=1 Tax=Volvox africanus TaxID=51714 RepID=A0ABQ5S725_9CHLO|nr:hypothetical protein VaNZ11_008595 [Volvox africanus]